MKKYLLASLISWLLLPKFSQAQYSAATLTGPWITGSSSDYTYIIFDGSSTVNELGFSGDSLHPAGTYSVSSPGVIASTINLIAADGGVNTINGNMVSDSFANILLDSTQARDLFKVSDPGALEGTWNGSIVDSVNQSTRNIQFVVNSSGTITSATGIGFIAGKIFEAKDTFTGYITTNDTSCSFSFISFSGFYTGNSLIGQKASLGKDGSTGCKDNGNGQFTRVSSGVTAVNPEMNFSVYPNPFVSQLDLTVRNPGNKMQVEVSDMLGRTIYAQEYGGVQNISLNLGELSSGVYMLRLNSDGKILTRRIVKN